MVKAFVWIVKIARLSLQLPLALTSPLISTIWCFRAYKPYIFSEDMILATCQCQHIFCSWVEPSLLLSSFCAYFNIFLCILWCRERWWNKCTFVLYHLHAFQSVHSYLQVQKIICTMRKMRTNWQNESRAPSMTFCTRQGEGYILWTKPELTIVLRYLGINN